MLRNSALGTIAALVLASSAAAATDDFMTGEVVWIDFIESKIYVRLDNGELRRFQVTPQTQIQFGDKASSELDLGMLGHTIRLRTKAGG